MSWTKRSSFGSLVFGAGYAFTAPAASNTNGSWAGVSKQMAESEGRTFLVESVMYDSIRKGLAALPSSAGRSASLRPAGEATNGYAALPRPPAAMQSSVAPRRAKAAEQASLANAREWSLITSPIWVRTPRFCKGTRPIWFPTGCISRSR